ncbi:MmgE/PrpD [Nocardioides sp. CF8]|uniref:MmgE/PrpD family protein n=1 Tax=Nocardioides sp. CF8 TaxID=110319 RepID=UPI00032F78D6|nr:MmgE/PrpD family protein [Nocardioides sp. CF8]EON22171.1 MmgE/PrpD [Nocardioides sp. CF8]
MTELDTAPAVPTAPEPRPAAQALAEWALALRPTAEDQALADRALLDTVAVGIVAREHHILRVGASLTEAARWAAACHVIDFDDLHMPSTGHLSTVCVPVALATGGGAAAYLAGAGVMARVGSALGWRHYSSGWHATTTSGALGAAVTAAVALGLDADRTARAIALAVPAAGGVQRAFGTDAKALQIGFAAEAGIRAATLAAAGATADLSAVDTWLRLVGGDPEALDLDGPAVPGGLAIKMYPACYALQRPISAVTAALGDAPDHGWNPATVHRVVVRTPPATVQPLIHHRPEDGLQGKFSLEYAVATALLDEQQGFEAFSDEAVRRPEAQRLLRLVEVTLEGPGDSLLSGQVDIEVHTDNGVLTATLQHPPGSPHRPPTEEELAHKVSTCLAGTDVDASAITWEDGATLLRRTLTGP